MFILGFFRDMSGSKLHKKIYKYGVFADEKFSTTKMMQICDGYRGNMKGGGKSVGTE